MNRQVICIVGCYSLHLYCANSCTVLNRAAEYDGPTRGYCYSQARRDGWLINHRKNHALCPRCSGKKGRQ